MSEHLVSGYFSCYPYDIMRQLVNIALHERKTKKTGNDVRADIDKAMTMYFAQSL